MISIYFSIAIAVGVGAFAVADALNQRHGSGSERRGLYAVAAGILWPVVAIGLLQILAVTAAVKLASVVKPDARKASVPTTPSR